MTIVIDEAHAFIFNEWDLVIATPKDGDFEHEFAWIIKSVPNDVNKYYVVLDWDGDAYHVEYEQLSFNIE